MQHVQKAPMDNKRKFVLDTKGGEPTRLLALSDGVFATVLTILVLDLKLDLGQNPVTANIGHSIVMLWPHLFSYVLTFLVTGQYWMGHHRAFDHIVHYDRRLLWYNLMFLLFIGLLPFTTAIFSSTGLTQGIFPVLWSFYVLDMVSIGLMLILIWGYAITHGLVDTEMTPETVHYLTVRQLATPLTFLLSGGIEFLSPATFLAQYFLLALPLILNLMDRLYLGKALPRPKEWRFSVEWLWTAAGLIPILLMLALAIWVAGYH
jgi:uncharacterized membrane protein